MNKFIHNLQRRNVIKAAISYAVIGWAILQVADILFPAFDIPDSTIRYILYSLIVCFPIWIVFAYAYEWTPSGFRKTKEVDEKMSVHQQTAKRLNVFIIGGLSIAVVLLITDRVFNFSGAIQDSSPVKSIAVLPFDNMSTDEDAYFAEGITEDILTQVSKIGDLRVLSRFTLKEYDPSGKSVEEIGEELGVGYLLTGSIRRAGEDLRISCQLVQVNPEEQTWAENFDRRMEDVFKIQSEISIEVASYLKANLSTEERINIERKPTDDLEAYNIYLKGKSLYENENLQDNELAINQFRKAVELDPNFADAWAGLCDAYGKSITQHGIRSYAFFDSIKVIAEHAVSLDNRSAEALGALAYQYLIKGDLKKAEEIVVRALTIQPNDPGNLNSLGMIYRTSGRMDEAIPLFEKARSLYPTRIEVFNYNIGTCYELLGMNKEAQYYFETVTEINKAEVITLERIAQVALNTGNKPLLREMVNKLLAFDRLDSDNRALYYAFHGRLNQDLIDKLISKNIKDSSYNYLDHYKTATIHAHALLQAGRKEQAYGILDSIYTTNIEQWGEEGLNEADVYAMIELMKGNDEKAFFWLQNAIDENLIFIHQEIKTNKILAPIVNTERYRKMSEKMEEDIARMRLNVTARTDKSRS